MPARASSPFLALAALVALAGCSFDGTALEERGPCDGDDDCPGGVCLAGSCWYGTVDGDVAVDADPDSADAGDSGDDGSSDSGDGGGVCPLAAPECRGQVAAACDDDGNVVLTNCANAGACTGGSCLCIDGACVPRACDPERRVCDGNSVLVCADDGQAFELLEDCREDLLCVGGTCAEPGCEPGESRCFGDVLAVCSPAGQFVEQTDCVEVDAFCDETASPQVCVTRVCEPESSRCGGGGESTQTCDDRGSAWLDPVPCATGTFCDNGVCVAEVCAPGAVFCSGPFSLATCDARGAAFATSTCDDGTRCADVDGVSSCIPQDCVPDTTECTEDLLGTRTCDPFGAGYLVVAPCLRDQFCEDAECVAQRCSPGSSRCLDDFTPGFCDGLGSTEVPAPCGAGTYCDDAGGVASCRTQICTPGAVRCRNAGQLEQCDVRGAAWVASTSCGSGNACFADACRPVICTVGETSCDSLAVERTCVDRGTAETTETCGTSESCRGGSCQPWACTPSSTFCLGSEVRTCAADGGSSTFVETCEFGCSGGACDEPECGDGAVTAASGEECDDRNTNACDGCNACRTEWGLSITGSTSTTAVAVGDVPGTGDLTFEAWVRITTNTTGALVGLRVEGNTDGAVLGLDAGRPYFSIDLGTDGGTTYAARALGPTSINDGRWHHIAGVRRVRDAALYVDGRLVAVGTVGGAFTSIDANRYFIGRDAGRGASATATIDEVRVSARRVYTAAFAPARRLPDAATGTVLVYHFDGESAANVLDSSTPVRSMVLSGTSLAADSCFGGTAANYTCGDGVVAPWEQCDDADDDVTDGCAHCLTVPVCAGGQIGPTGNCYTQTAEGQWTAAEAACVAAGGHLVTVGSWVENAWLAAAFSITGFGNAAWIGLNDRTTEGTFVWSSGAPVTYTAWNTREPNNNRPGDGEDCAHVINADGAWNDNRCNDNYRGICER